MTMKDKTILITGGSKGLGELITDSLREDYNVICLSRTMKVNPFDGLRYIECDITNSNDILHVYDILEREDIKLNCIINNAGIINRNTVNAFDKRTFEADLSTNTIAPIEVVSILNPLLIKNESSIINISSISGKYLGSSISYCVSKAGLDMATKFMAKELYSSGIRVNSISPGFLNTGMQINNNIATENTYKASIELFKEKNTMVDCSCDSVIEMVRYLLTAKGVTGQDFMVDGSVILK